MVDGTSDRTWPDPNALGVLLLGVACKGNSSYVAAVESVVSKNALDSQVDSIQYPVVVALDWQVETKRVPNRQRQKTIE